MIPIFSKVSLDTSELSKGLTRAQKRLGAFKASVMKAGAAIGVAFSTRAAVAAIQRWADELDRIGKLATRLNTSAEAIQRIGFAAEQSGSNLEQAADGLTKISRLATRTGDKTIAGAFKELNIEQAKFAKLSPEKQLAELARGFTSASDRGRAFDAVYRLLEDSAKQLLPLLEQGEDGVNKLFNQINPASNEAVKAAENLNDQLNILDKQLLGAKGRAVEFANELVGGLRLAVNKLQNGPNLVDWLFNSGGIEKKRLEKEAKDLEILKQADPKIGALIDSSTKLMRGAGSTAPGIVDRAGVNLSAGPAAGITQTLGAQKFLNLFQEIERGTIGTALGIGSGTKGKALFGQVIASQARAAGLSPTVSMGDSLARVGGGGNVATQKNPAVRALEEQIKKQAQELELLRSIRDNTGKSTLLQGGD